MDVPLRAKSETNGVPSNLLDPVVVDKTNIQSTVIEEGIYTAAEICTPELADECAKLGLK